MQLLNQVFFFFFFFVVVLINKIKKLFYSILESEASLDSDESEGKDWSDLEEEAAKGLKQKKFINFI